MRIEILTVAGCPNSETTRRMVYAGLAEVGIRAEVTVTEIGDEGQARARRFLGSPTVQVDGVDIEPARRAEAAFGLTCRVYRSDAGVSGAPPRDLIDAALREAG